MCLIISYPSEIGFINSTFDPFIILNYFRKLKNLIFSTISIDEHGQIHK